MTSHAHNDPAPRGADQPRSTTTAGPNPRHTIVCATLRNAKPRSGRATAALRIAATAESRSPWVVDANESTFDVEVKAQPTVVLDLWAPWCGPCRFVSPILDELAHEYAGRLKVVKVNVDENQGLARRFDAMSIPTIVVMRDGEVVNRIVGAAPKEQMEAQIAPYLKPPKSASGAAAA